MFQCSLLIAKYVHTVSTFCTFKWKTLYFSIFLLYFLGCHRMMNERKNGIFVLPFLSRLRHCAMAFVAKKDPKCYCNYYHCDLHDSMLFCVSRERLLLSMRWFLLLSCQCCQLCLYQPKKRRKNWITQSIDWQILRYFNILKIDSRVGNTVAYAQNSLARVEW